jgi:hypothetical protein
MLRRLAALALVALLPACAPKRETPDAADIRAARQAALTFDQRMSREIIARLDRDEDPVAVYLAYADNVPGWGKALSDAAAAGRSPTITCTTERRGAAGRGRSPRRRAAARRAARHGDSRRF